ncbi:exo-alpha-sialidase [Rhodopirellula sp. P2]|uniref:exo-alpha-sialidase n=1 Tax=Rhodopirellula sp. P2 TaxID=2127060 RepID=UPI002368C4C1|nr:exo-alpha-sialidase [Rhodopirellula sp. P2]WDQ16530.1 exo-alpha-sialidase [Rhodopirellula sp. P2]
MIASVVSLPIGNWVLRLLPLLAALLAGWMAAPASGQTMPGFYNAFGKTGTTRSRHVASTSETFDLPATYVSASQFAEDASLHAVSVSPDGNVLVAVGDWGVIVRSEDAGRTWRNLASGVDLALCDVRFLNETRVVAVGGGYEPVTGLSRGVAIASDDAGRTWHRVDALEATKLHRMAVRNSFDAEPLPAGSLEAIGDDAEASAGNRFHSFDGGLTWLEDTAQSPESRAKLHDWLRQDALVQDSQSARQTKGEGWRVRVGTHGIIERSTDDGQTWDPVRGAGRAPAVMFVAASEQTVPWALIGRETLEMKRRVVVVLDSAKPAGAHTVGRLGRVRHAAMRLGVAKAVWCSSPTSDRQPCVDLLQQHQPAVVVLDANLPESTRKAWVSATLDDSNFPLTASLIRKQPRRVYASELQAGAVVSSSRSVALRSDALLSGRAVLAGDLALDAMMVVAPGMAVPESVVVSPVPGTSTELRRDLSLTGGLVLAAGQQFGSGVTDQASRRRLQIATARMSQLSRLKELLRDPGLRSKELADTLEVLLPRTASEDRTRMLWWLWIQTRHAAQLASSEGNWQHAQSLTACEDILLRTMVDAAPVDSVRRWADCMLQARQESFERSVVSMSPSQPGWLASKAGGSHPDWGGTGSANRDGVTRAGNGFGNAGGQQDGVQSGMHWQTQSLSPFAVKPVAYESTPPASKSRSSAGGMARAGSLNALASGALESSLPTLPPMSQRTNWEYHPVVMAARRISGVGLGEGPSDEESTSSTRSPTRKSNALPRVVSRPRLDCELDDACWSDLRWQRTDDLMFACVTDGEYLYVAVVDSGNSGGSQTESGRPQALELWIDGDGDLMSSFCFGCDSRGNRQASVDGTVRWQPNWYAALSGWSENESSDGADSESSVRRGPRVLAEIAIPLVEILPRADSWSRFTEQFGVRVRSSQAGDSADSTPGRSPSGDAGRLASDFQALPDPQHWRFFPMPRE